MERVSFKVAKAIKEAGYPQDIIPYGYNINVVLCTNVHETKHPLEYLPAPTYIEVWFWLWREKNIQIDVVSTFKKTCFVAIWKSGERIFCQGKIDDLEKAIIVAIEYLVDNKLLK